MRIASIYGPLGVGMDYIRYLPAAKADQAISPELDLDSPHNIGDWFVTKIVDRLVDYDELVFLPADASDAEWDYVNGVCDVLILKGGNYIQPDWFSRHFGLDFFKRIRIPIVLFGAGLQTWLGGRVEFTPEEIAILHYIHESSACSSVRGERTAEALATIGIHNVAVTGCPTIFWSRQPSISVRESRSDSAAFTFRQFLYSDDEGIHRAQFDAIRDSKRRFGNVTVVLQGEEVLLQHYLQATKWEAERAATVTDIPGSRLRRLTRELLDPAELREGIDELFAGLCEPEFMDWLVENTFFSYDVGEYLDLYRSQGLVLGCRLHSNLLALANGTPAFCLTYDERTQEIVELMSIPHCRLSAFNQDVDVVGADWKPFEARYRDCYSEMVRFLEANSLRHLLPAEVSV